MIENRQEWVGRMADVHGRMVFQAAYRIVGNADDAEDALQAVFLRLLRDTQPRHADNWGAYLRTMATNAALDLLRARSRRREDDLEAASGLPDTRQPAADAVASSGQLARFLREALTLLPEREAQAFALRHFEELSCAEIAEQLGVTANNAAVIVSRARARLREHLAPCFPGRMNEEHAHAEP